MNKSMKTLLATVALVGAFAMNSLAATLTGTPGRLEADSGGEWYPVYDSVSHKPVILLNTNVTADPTTLAPQGYGQVAVGTVSSKVWIASGLTTNDWMDVASESFASSYADALSEVSGSFAAAGAVSGSSLVASNGVSGVYTAGGFTITFSSGVLTGSSP